MSVEATAKPVEWTEHDREEQLTLLFWFHGLREAGRFTEYAGRHVAIHNSGIVDSDIDEPTLLRRLSEQYPEDIIVVQRVPGPDDPTCWKASMAWDESD
jgi:hypothetical protein